VSETTVKVTLGKFLSASMREKISPDLQDAARTALTHYVLKLRLGRPPVPVPKGLGQATEEPEESFYLTVDEGTKDLLIAEAERQETTLVDLTGHSMFVYLAELDLISTALSHHETT
jgi:hypothetical protein